VQPIALSFVGGLLMLVGLTGNIAVGKSTVLAMLKAHGAFVIDADQAAHRVLEPGGSAFGQVVARFPSVLQADGTISRPALGQIVFGDPTALGELEAITHPAISKLIWDEVAWAKAEGYAVIVIDAVKLIEGRTKLADRVDTIWVVTCNPTTQRERLIHRNNYSPAEADARLAAQPPLAEKLARADLVIDNSGTVAETQAQVAAGWVKLISGHL